MKKTFFVLLLISLFMACDSQDECTFGDTEVSCLEELGCINTAHQLVVSTSNEFELIRTQEEFDAIVSGSCTPTIDWEKNDLVVGMVGLPNGLVGIEKSLFNDCGLNQYNLTFTILLNATTEAPIVSYNAIIPKLTIDQTVFVEVLINS